MNGAAGEKLRALWNRDDKVRYVIVGAWNTVFAYLAFAVIYAVLHARAHYLIVSVVAHEAAVGNAFLCQRYLVFNSKAHWFASFVRFNVAQLLVLAFGLTALAVVVEVVHVQPLLGQLLIMTATTLLSYLLSRFYSFAS